MPGFLLLEKEKQAHSNAKMDNLLTSTRSPYCLCFLSSAGWTFRLKKVCVEDRCCKHNQRCSDKHQRAGQGDNDYPGKDQGKKQDIYKQYFLIRLTFYFFLCILVIRFTVVHRYTPNGAVAGLVFVEPWFSRLAKALPLQLKFNGNQ